MNNAAWRRPNPVFSDEYRVIVQVWIEARKRAGVSQRRLGSLLEKSGSHICMIESGQRRVDLLEFYRMAVALGESPIDLFCDLSSRIEVLDGRP